MYVELIDATIYLLWGGRLLVRAKSLNVWKHSGSLQPLIIVTGRWRNIQSSLHSSPAATFSRPAYIFFLGIYISSTLFVIILSYLPSYKLFNFYLILPTFNFFPSFYFLSFFFIFFFSSLFLPFVFTVSLLVISFRLLRQFIPQYRNPCPATYFIRKV